MSIASEPSPRSGATRVRWQVRLRWIAALACGTIVAVMVVPWLGLIAGVLAGWAALGLVSVAVVVSQVWRMDAVQTRLHATAEAPGRRAARVIALIGSLASLGAVVVVVVQANSASRAEAPYLAAIAVLSVVSSWLLIQSDYMLHYAASYYAAGSEGGPLRGIDFKQAEDPEYTDFAYFAVGLGMTYQVADTDVSRNAIRRIVIAQTLIAYLFGAGILATIINLISGLASGS